MLNDASIKPQETLFIDDCEVNIIGARNVVLNGLSTSNAYIAFSNASVGQWRIGNR